MWETRGDGRCCYLGLPFNEAIGVGHPASRMRGCLLRLVLNQDIGLVRGHESLKSLVNRRLCWTTAGVNAPRAHRQIAATGLQGAPTPAQRPRRRRADASPDARGRRRRNVVALVSLCRRSFPCCLWNHICEKYYSSKSAKVAAVPKNVATDDGDTITVEAPPGRLGLEFEGLSAIVKEVLFSSPLAGKVHPGDVLKSVNGVAVTGGKCLTNAAAAADDGANPRTLAPKTAARTARGQRPSPAWAPWAGPRR